MKHRKTAVTRALVIFALFMTAAAALANQSDLGRLGECDLYQSTPEWHAPRQSEYVLATANHSAFLSPIAFLQDNVRPVLPEAKQALTPTLTVMGQAQLDKPADQMRITIGVVTQGDDPQTAMQENTRQMNDVIAALQEAGLTKEEYQTGQFQVQPRYSNPPRGHVDQNWKPQIIGYDVINRVQVKTKKLNLAGDLIKAATDAGANSIDSIGFDLADPRKHRAEAISAATGNARADAEALARASGQRLVRILSINLDSAPVHPMPEMRTMGRMAMADAEMAPPIEPGEITVHASVTIVYEINAQE
jgi:uncharacterized protein